MRITLHLTGDTRKQASLGRINQQPRWLKEGYHPLNNGYEFRLQTLNPRSVMLFVRPVGSKQTKSMTVPVLGHRMSFEFEVNEHGEPVWAMQQIIRRLLDEYEMTSGHIHLRAAGTSLYLPSAQRSRRTLVCSELANRFYNLTLRRGEAPVDCVDRASWVVGILANLDGSVSTDAYVWTDLHKKPDEQESLWRALQ